MENHVAEGGIDALVFKRKRMGVTVAEFNCARCHAFGCCPFLPSSIQHGIGTVEGHNIESELSELECEDTGSCADVGNAQLLRDQGGSGAGAENVNRPSGRAARAGSVM